MKKKYNKHHILTFDKSTKYWKKRINGRVVLFGRAKKKSDYKAYQAARSKYYEYIGKSREEKIDNIPLDNWLPADADGKFDKRTLNHWYDRYLKLVNNSDITFAYKVSKMRYLRVFYDFCGSGVSVNNWMNTSKGLNKLKLHNFIEHLQRLYVDGTYSRHTIRLILARAKEFIHWLYNKDALKELPRNISDLSMKSMPKRTNIPQLVNPYYDKIDIHKIIDHYLTDNVYRPGIKSRTLCFLLLALNLGGTQRDIATLCLEDIDFERKLVTRLRKKTGISSSHRLWGITIRLMKLCYPERKVLDENNKQLFFYNTRSNKPLYKDPLKNPQYISGFFVFDEILKRTFPNERPEYKRSFKSLRKSCATMFQLVPGIDNPLEIGQRFLAHKPDTMIELSYYTFIQERLHNALDKMEEYLELDKNENLKQYLMTAE